MKKKLTIILSIVILCVSVLSVLLLYKPKGDNLITINEVTHSIFYAPLYVAINNGYFEEEGIEIELVNGGGSDQSMTALISDNADIALLGPETAVYVIRQGLADHPVIFAQLTKRDGSFLIGRTAEPDFEWGDLAGKEIIGGRRGGMPAMSLEYALRQNGLIPGNNVTLNLDVAFNMVAGAFEGGLGDYCTMFEPTASAFVAAGKGHIITAVGTESGEIPFTAFMAKQSFLKEHPEKIESFINAVMRGYDFIMTSEISAVTNALLPSFSGSTSDSIGTAITSYKLIDAWMSSPAMEESAFTRMQTVMSTAGELSGYVAFTEAVDNSFADAWLTRNAG